MGATPQVSKSKKITPGTTGKYPVSVTVEKDGKTVTESSDVTLYASAEELLTQAFGGNMDNLLEQFNQVAWNKAKALARQNCYVVLAGPSKAIYANARKMYRDAIKFKATDTMTPQVCFELAKKGYAYLPESAFVEYDESKIVKDEEEETEETDNE